MSAKIQHFLEISKFFADKDSLCNDFLSLWDVLEVGKALKSLHIEKQKDRAVGRPWVSRGSPVGRQWVKKIALQDKLEALSDVEESLSTP